jgi:hypothetical protein
MMNGIIIYPFRWTDWQSRRNKNQNYNINHISLFDANPVDKNKKYLENQEKNIRVTHNWVKRCNTRSCGIVPVGKELPVFYFIAGLSGS